MSRATSTRFRFGLALVVAASLGAGLVGCGDKIITSSGTPPPPVARGAALAGTADAGLSPIAKPAEVSENDFVENDHNRDPFRSYVSLFIDKGTPKIKNQLQVIVPQYSIDEMKLVAIVTGGDYPRAMLLDPTGKGWVVKKGDYLGRPDTVHTGGTNGTDYQLNWRVDRVRDGDLVLNRQDPVGGPPATRVIPLHPEADKNNGDTLQRL